MAISTAGMDARVAYFAQEMNLKFEFLSLAVSNIFPMDEGPDGCTSGLHLDINKGLIQSNVL